MNIRGILGVVLLAAAASVAGTARADHAVLEGEAAMAKLPASVRAMGLWHAKWTQVTNGVEYVFARFTALYSNANKGVQQYGKNDLHIVRIEYGTAPVLMKMVESSPKTKRTSVAAKGVDALFGINGTFQCATAPLGPQLFTKTDGVIIRGGSTGTSGDGIAFKNGSKEYAFGRGFKEENTADWDSVISTEAYGLVNGSVNLSPTGNWGLAPYTFVGEAPGNVIYLFVVDGRSSDSVGMSYGTCCQLMHDFGCTEGMVFDGGGSTTMVFRKDMLPAEEMAYTQKTAADTGDYWVMNKPSDGSERAVINQLLFVAQPPPPRSIETVATVAGKKGEPGGLDVTVTSGAEASWLYAAWGDRDYGEALGDWPNRAYLAELAPGVTNLVNAPVPAGWSPSSPNLRLFLARKPDYDSEVDYLASTDGACQYMDTAYFGQSDDVYEFKVRFDKCDATFFLGSRGNGSGSYYSYFYGRAGALGMGFRCNAMTAAAPSGGVSAGPQVGVDYYVRTTMGRSEQKLEAGYSADESTWTLHSTGAADLSTIGNTYFPQWLFGANQQAGNYYSAYPFIGRMYYWRVKHAGQTVMDLIPVSRKGVGYMYDKVSGRMLANKAATPLVVGPAVTANRDDVFCEATSASPVLTWTGDRPSGAVDAGTVRVLARYASEGRVRFVVSARPAEANGTNVLYLVNGTAARKVGLVTASSEPFVVELPEAADERTVRFELRRRTGAQRCALAYIASTSGGRQHVDTGWSGDYGDAYEARYRNEGWKQDASDCYCLLGAYTEGLNNLYDIGYASKSTSVASERKLGIRFNGDVIQKGLNAYSGVDTLLVAEISSGSQHIAFGEDGGMPYGRVKTSRTDAINARRPTLYLFAEHYDRDTTAAYTDNTMWLQGRLYWLKIRHNGALVRDYVPCLQNGVAGVWDRVNGTFSASRSGTPFVAGPVVEDDTVAVWNEEAVLSAKPDACAWTPPADMPGTDAGARCAAALVADGIAPETAARLADELLYGKFAGWTRKAGLGPADLRGRAGVVLAAAYGVDAPPAAADVKLSIEEVEPIADIEGGLSLSLKVESDGFDPSKVDEDLLKAALGLSGSPSLDAASFSPDVLDVTFGEVRDGTVPVTVRPHATAGKTPATLFMRATAR